MTSANPAMSMRVYPPHVLREYALLADGERGALIGPRGDIAWMCAPSWDSDAVFCTLIGGDGIYAVTPLEPFVWGGYYEDGTLIWRSRWTTGDGIIECREALALPADPATAILLRRIIAVDGPARVSLMLDARARYGRHRMRQLRCHQGTWTAQTGPLHLRWSGAGTARPGQDGVLVGSLELDAGGHHDLVLELSPHALPVTTRAADVLWRITEQAWAAQVPACEQSVAPGDARHAYAVLLGLTSSGGGMVAAATTSLPERAEQGRNYDYRYVWIRDQALTGQAVAAAGDYALLDDAVRFVSARLLDDGPNLAPAYTTAGRRVPDERSLDLPGYPGGFDIVGNHVNAQFQLDTFGESLLLLAAAARCDHLDADGWRAAQAAADAVEARWYEDDAGIWELDVHRWTESKLICVAGLRAIAAVGAPAGRAGGWQKLADTILADTSARAMHPTGRWQRATDDAELDAALLLPPLRGALPADDPRTSTTLHAIEEALAEDHYLYRFRQQPGRLHGAEGAFLLCGFVMAMAQHQQHETVKAFRWFERNRSACGPAGLFSEEYDVAQRQLRGNLPQAFVHALMFEASIRLAGAPEAIEP